jgi:hypothetical protein
MNLLTETALMLLILGAIILAASLVFIVAILQIRKLKEELAGSHDLSERLADDLMNQIGQTNDAISRNAGHAIQNAAKDRIIKSLQEEKSRKFQPRGKGGLFLSNKATKEFCEKYLCVSMQPKDNPVFTEGKEYVRYDNGKRDGLILIGNDRSRHYVEEFEHCFKLVDA